MPIFLGDLWDFDAAFLMPADLNKAALARIRMQFSPSPKTAVRLHAFWRTVFELLGLIAASSQGRGTIFMPSSVPVAISSRSQVSVSEDLVGIYRMYLRHRTTAPRVESIDELLRLREDRRLVPLLTVLGTWLEAGREGDIDLARRVAADVGSAEKDLKRVKKLQHFSDIASIISLPVTIADAVLKTPFSLAFAPIGPAVSLWTRSKTKKFGWLRFGEPD
jgi:hypothetical protein